MYILYNDVKQEIYNTINIILDEFLLGRTLGTQHAKNIITKDEYDSYFQNKRKTIYDAAKDFSKNKNILQLIKDTNYTGYNIFKKINNDTVDDDNLKKYIIFFREILAEMIEDRIALDKDKKNLKTFEQYNKKTSLDEL